MEAFYDDTGDPIKVGRTRVSASILGAFFEDKADGTTFDISGLESNGDGGLVGNAVVGDANGPLTEPVPVMIEEGTIEEAKKFRMFFKEHGKELGFGTATVVVVAVGSLVVRRKYRN